MLQTIDRKLYDAERTEQIGKYAPNIDREDSYFLIETELTH